MSYDILSYDKKYDGYQAAKKIRAEDAGSRRADQAGQIAQKSQYRSDCRTYHLFTPHGFAHRERSADSGYMYLSQSALCASIR